MWWGQKVFLQMRLEYTVSSNDFADNGTWILEVACLPYNALADEFQMLLGALRRRLYRM